jgi:hypothetical protein
MGSQGSRQLLPEMTDKQGPSVRNSGLGHTMPTQDASNIQFIILLCPLVGVQRNEVSRLGESIHNHPDGIKLAGRERQTHNEIHAGVFPFSGRNIQRL